MSSEPTKVDTGASAAGVPAGGSEPTRDRLQWLFRDALRQRRVHPLMALLARYREARTP